MKQNKKQNGTKINVILLHGFWACCGLISCFFPRKKKVISLHNSVVGTHAWLKLKSVFISGKKIKRNFEKRRKNERYLYAGGIILIHFQCLITNLSKLILLCPYSCCSFVTSLFSLKIWKVISRLGPESQEQNWCPRCLITSLACCNCLVVYVLHSNHLFCSDLLCFENDCRTGLFITQPLALPGNRNIMV